MEYNQKKFSKKINLGNLIAHLVELESTAAAKVLNPTHASMSPIFFILSKLSYQNKTLESPLTLASFFFLHFFAVVQFPFD